MSVIKSISSLRHRWTKKLRVFELDKIFIPCNFYREHWVLVEVCVQRREIHVYDSCYYDCQEFTNATLRWLEDVADDLKLPFAKEEWVIISKFTREEIETVLVTSGNRAYLDAMDKADLQKYVPKQAKNDCGVFVCLFVDFLLDDLPLFKSLPKTLKKMRQKIACDIMRGYILDY